MLTFILIIIYLAFISLGLPDSLLGSAWPVMRGEVQASLSSAGIVSMIVTGGTIVSSLLSNRLIRRYGTGKLTMVSVFMTAAALGGFSASRSVYMLYLLAIPLGLGAGAVDAGLNNFVALHYKVRHMNWLHCFWGIGATSGPIIMSLFLSRQEGWRGGYFTIAIIQIVLTAALFITLPIWKKVEGKEDGKQPDGSDSGNVRKLLSLNNVKVTLTAFFCYCALELTTGLWGSSYLVSFRGLSAGQAAQWISLFYLGITMGRFITGFISMKISTHNLVRLGEGLILSGVFLLILPVNPSACIIGFILIGLGCAPIYPGMLHDTPKRVGSENSQAMMGIQMAFAYVGNTIMPPLFGFLASVTNMSIFPVFLLVLLLVMIYCVEKSSNRSANVFIE